MSGFIDVSCQVCGRDLGGYTVDRWIEVPPCKTCMEKALRQGYDEGHTEGREESYERGLEEND